MTQFSALMGTAMRDADEAAERFLERKERVEQYEAFLASKRLLAPSCGFEVADEDINPMLFPFQRDIVRWALLRG